MLKETMMLLQSTSTIYKQRTWRILSMLVVCALASIALACIVGSTDLSFSFTDVTTTILEWRLERALSAFITGAALSLAGVMMQALLRNPLADPYVLGVSGGAAMGALTAMLFFSAAWMIDCAAFGGALLVAVLLFFLTYRNFHSEAGHSSTLLLTGVMISSGCMALVTLILSIAPDSNLRGMVFWMIGDLSGASARYLPWSIVIIGLLFSCRFARAINVLALHADTASTLGIQVSKLKQGLFFCSALLTASAVSNAGSIGFVGLIVPHACRFAFGHDHRVLFPAATLAGGTFLVLADTLARSLLAPQQLPVGVITALIGVPLFLLQLHYVVKK